MFCEGNKTNINDIIRLSWSSCVRVSNVAPPLSQQCVSTSCTVVVLSSQTATMMACILDTSTPPPPRKPCWLLDQVWLRYKIPIDMVRLTHISMGLGFHPLSLFLLIFVSFFTSLSFSLLKNAIS